MIKITLFVYTITIHLLYSVNFSFALLYFQPLQDSGPSFKNDVFKRLKDIPNSHVCIWSRQTGVEELVDDLLLYFTTNGKAVSSLKLTEEFLFRDECLHNVLLLKNLSACDNNIWRTRQPITALHFVYVVVDAEWWLGVENLTSCLGVFGFARVVLVFLQNERVFSLSPPQFPPRRFLEARLDDLLLPTKLVFNNLRGREVNVATFNCTPHVVFYDGFFAESMDGVEGRILKELSLIQNFKMNILEMSKVKHGSRSTSNRAWLEDGIMGALKTYRAEIGICSIWSDLMNIEVLDFAPFNNLVSYTFLVPRPQLVRGSWKTLTNIFEPDVWWATVFSFFGCSLCYWLHSKVFAPNDNINGVESLLVVFGMLMLTSWHSRTAARQLVLWWSVFVLLLTATYSSSIAARLTKPRYEPRIDTIQQLVDFDFHWYGDNMSDDLIKFILHVADPTQREWSTRYRYLPVHMTRTAVNSRKYAFVVQRLGSSMLVLRVHGLDFDQDLKDMRVFKEKTLSNIFTCFGFPKQSALSYSLQYALLTLRQMGLVERWSRDAVKQFMPRYVQDLQQEQDVHVNVELTPLTVYNLKPAFYMLIAGLFLSSLVFFFELLYKKWTCRHYNGKKGST